MIENRLARLRAKMKEMELEALLVSTPENRQYLSGFTGSAGYLLISQDKAILATDFRYVEQAGGQAPLFEILQVGAWSWLIEQLENMGAHAVGFESQHMTMAAYRRIVAAVKELPSEKRPTIKATSDLVENLRAVKDKIELALLEKVISISDKAMETVTPRHPAR